MDEIFKKVAILSAFKFYLIYKVIVGINMSNQFDYKYKIPFGSQIAPQQNSETVMPAAPSVPAVNSSAPAMQGEIIKPEALKQSVQDSYVSNRVGQFEEIDPLKLWSVGLPAWYVAAQSMDVFAKASRGADYSKTIQGRIGNVGDKISGIFTDNKLAKSAPMKTFAKKLTSVRKWISKKAFDNSAVLRSFKTPSQPELDMVRGQANGMRGFLMYDYPQVAENFIENNIKHVKDLDCYGADKAFVTAKKNLIKNGASVSEVLERAQFELLSPNKDPKVIDKLMKLKPEVRERALKSFKAKAIGYKGLKHFEAVKGDIQNRWREVLKACEKANPKMYSKIWSSDKNWWTKFKGHIMGRRVYMSEFKNKIISATGQLADGSMAQKSKLGRFLPKITNYFLEGATNRVAGGKFVALMNATLLADVIIRTANADKSDKLQTFTERTSEMIGFFVFAPMALRLLHMFGGVQYAGISDKTITKLLTKLDAKKASMAVGEYNAAKEVLLKAQKAMKTKNPTEAYREALKFFNDKATNASYSSKSEYKAAKKAVKNILKGDTWNPLVKLAKKTARFVTVGLEQPAAYRTKALHLPEGMWKKGVSMFKDCFKHPKYWFKQGAGYPVRIIGVMLMLMPFLNKLGVKLTHAIFGRPSKSILDKESDAQKQLTPEQQAELEKYMAELQKQQAEKANADANYKPNLSSPTNLLNMAKNNQSNENPLPNKVEDVKSDISSPSNLINMAKRGENYKNELPLKKTAEEEKKEPETAKEPEPKLTEPVRTYVPSSEPVKINGEQKKKKKELSDVELAMKKTEEAEKLAMQTLAMKW